MSARTRIVCGGRARARARGLVAVGAILASTASGACQRAPRAVEPPRPTTLIPRNAFRFAIERVEDSIALFRPAEVRWLKAGMSVYAVDPTKQDALVARLRIVDADSGRFRALVIGQVTSVQPEHVLLAVQPPRRWSQDLRFWAGVVTGAVFGAGVVAFFQ